jgi:hypothetical protein
VLTPTISIEGIDDVTLYELSQHLPPESVSAKSSASGGRDGELATTIVILVGVPAVKGLVDWIMKDRTTEEEEKILETSDASGRVHRETIRTLKHTSKSKEGLFAHLVKLCGITLPKGL